MEPFIPPALHKSSSGVRVASQQGRKHGVSRLDVKGLQGNGPHSLGSGLFGAFLFVFEMCLFCSASQVSLEL